MLTLIENSTYEANHISSSQSIFSFTLLSTSHWTCARPFPCSDRHRRSPEGTPVQPQYEVHEPSLSRQGLRLHLRLQTPHEFDLSLLLTTLQAYQIRLADFTFLIDSGLDRSHLPALHEKHDGHTQA